MSDVLLAQLQGGTTGGGNAANFGGGFQPISSSYGHVYSGGSTAPLTDFEKIVTTSIGVITVVAGIFFIVYFFLAAFKWLSAGGDSGKVQKARDEMVQGVLGLIIMVAAYGVIGLVSTIVGIDILKPASSVCTIIGLSC